ncbi:hypothetical protein Q3G72_033395 [Acer saccharum]|nr:hypothetical protein Q3G72_033395 [Acer saccharum]
MEEIGNHLCKSIQHSDANPPLLFDENISGRLSNDYKELKAAVRTRETTMTFEELHDKLLDHETCLNRDEGKTTTPTVTAQYNQHLPSNKNKQGGGSSNHRGQDYHSGNKNNQLHTQGYSNTQGSRPPSFLSLGHNFSTSGGNFSSMNHIPVHSHFQQTTWRPNPNYGQPRPVCQLCDKVGHTTKVCRSRPKPNSNQN